MKKTAKNSYGLSIINNKKVFLKICNYDIKNEIDGYNLISKLYKCPKLLSYDMAEKKLIFEYCKSFDTKILHKALYQNESENFDLIINTLTAPITNLKLTSKNKLRNETFFSGRKAAIEKYLTLENVNKKIIFNEFKLPSFKKTIKNFIKLSNKNYKLYSCILQGDPTDLNCTLDGYITDYEIGGNNSIAGEIAIFCGCYIVNSYYYYIKYMQSAHSEYVETLEKFKHYIQPKSKTDKKYLTVTTGKILPKKNIDLMIKYLQNIIKIISKKEKKNIEKYLNSYLSVRLISPINLKNVDLDERHLLFALSTLFFKKVKKIEDLITIISNL